MWLIQKNNSYVYFCFSRVIWSFSWFITIIIIRISLFKHKLNICKLLVLILPVLVKKKYWSWIAISEHFVGILLMLWEDACNWKVNAITKLKCSIIMAPKYYLLMQLVNLFIIIIIIVVVVVVVTMAKHSGNCIPQAILML